MPDGIWRERSFPTSLVGPVCQARCTAVGVDLLSDVIAAKVVDRLREALFCGLPTSAGCSSRRDAQSNSR